MTQYHEPAEELSPEDRDITRAWISMKEEVEAIYWYHQRAATCTDAELRKILVHNRDEEIEHAVMTLEWLRRRMPAVDDQLREILFTSGSIAELEDDEGEQEASEGSSRPGSGLGIGKAR